MVLDLFKKCIQEFNLDVKHLRDIAFAICIADKLDGTNKKELDIDKFVESDNELDWNDILKTLGVSPQNRGCGSLPRVQKLRVISDILTISLCSQIEDLVLSCKVSKQVSEKEGVFLSCIDYADEDACYENLNKIKDYLVDNSFNKDFEVESVLNLLRDYNFSYSGSITSLDKHYTNVNNLFLLCASDKFNKRNFYKDLNCVLIKKLIDLDDYKWISLYNLFVTASELLNNEKVVCCISAELNSKLRKCTRLYNGLDLVGKMSYSVYDYRFTKILLICMYSFNFVDDFQKYVLGGN